MSWISEAHNQWHTVHGQNVVCPLDCGVGEGYDDYEQEPMTPEQEADLNRWRAAQEAPAEGDPWAIAPF